VVVLLSEYTLHKRLMEMSDISHDVLSDACSTARAHREELPEFRIIIDATVHAHGRSVRSFEDSGDVTC
jgi:hypothetical protein